MMHKWLAGIALLISTGATPAVFASGDLSEVAYGEKAMTFFVGFIRPHVSMIGVVARTDYNRQILGKGDLIYLRMKNLDEVNPGDLYTVYRRVHEVFHPATGRYLGDLLNVVAVVQAVNVTDGFVVARIERSFISVSPEDGVMPFSLPQEEEVSLIERALPEKPGMIVELQTQRTLIGQSNAVYLDWGWDDGLQVGDVLEVFRKRTNYPTQTIGELRVVALEDHTATALVARSMQPLSVGDRFVLKEVVKESDQQGESGGPPTRRVSAGQAAVHETLTQSLKAEIAKGDVSIKQVGNKIKINLGDLVDQLEYESGQPTIKPSGAPILKQISDILKTMTDQDIVVEGHTDSMPIGRTLMAKFPTNQELSEARAGLVVRYFIQEGIDPKSLSAIGYAERRPVASNRSEEGRRKNRRIEIELSPKESADQAPASPADANERSTPPSSSRLN